MPRRPFLAQERRGRSGQGSRLGFPRGSTAQVAPDQRRGHLPREGNSPCPAGQAHLSRLPQRPLRARRPPPFARGCRHGETAPRFRDRQRSRRCRHPAVEGQGARETGRIPEAIADCEAALAAAPGDPSIRWLRAGLLLAAGRQAEALREFEAIRAQHPDLPALPADDSSLARLGPPSPSARAATRRRSRTACSSCARIPRTRP